MRAAEALLALAALAAALTMSSVPAAGQARGVIIQIPDDVAPGATRPSPAPPAQTAPVAEPSSAAARAACQSAVCAPEPNAWHVLNTSNKTCLVLSKHDLIGGKDVRKLSTLLPAPLFVVASGACP